MSLSCWVIVMAFGGYGNKNLTPQSVMITFFQNNLLSPGFYRKQNIAVFQKNNSKLKQTKRAPKYFPAKIFSRQKYFRAKYFPAKKIFPPKRFSRQKFSRQNRLIHRKSMPYVELLKLNTFYSFRN